MAERIFLESILDFIEEGIIAIQEDGDIVIYNRKAKEIFGILYDQGSGHGEGKIEDGDIVIIGDNDLGKDDGGLTGEDLKIIGIEEQTLNNGSAVVAIGIMGAKAGTAFYKLSKNDKFQENLMVEKQIREIKIKVEIDFCSKKIEIAVNDQIYPYKYINAVGHMVVVDGKTGKIKFYQAKGYTVRQETLKSLLNGGYYYAKGRNTEVLDVIGKSVLEAHPKESGIEEFLQVAQGGEGAYQNQIREINGRPIRCSLMPILKGKKVRGAALKVEDVTELKSLKQERDMAIASLSEAENKYLKEKEREDAFSNFIGESANNKTVIKLAQKAADTDSTVLILGESGTGKGVVAEAIHRASKRKKAPFVYVNCAAIPENLLESQLFGYNAGAFTGAKKEGEKGFFEVAAGGTIFLDEIGEIPLFVQAKLLHVLQTKRFSRVGGTREIRVDVKIITATNKDLAEEVRLGRFRKDLYYRINIFPIYIPPLREKKEDIYLLIHSLLPKISKKIGVEEKRISGDAIKALTQYDWPGNVRELENVLERAINIADGNVIFKEHIDLEVRQSGLKVEKEEVMLCKSLKAEVQEAEKRAIKKALIYAKGDKKEAMRILGIGKTSFYEKVKEYGLE